MPEQQQEEVETFAFQADIGHLLRLIIQTFYSNREIFICQLISNSSDALDKFRYESKLDFGKDLFIKVILNKSAGTLTIIDNGVGMTKIDLINNLGTIARSGTKSFMEALKSDADFSMIGQFGVGFYSAYLVADSVTVITKHNDDKQYVWESSAKGTFTIKEDNSDAVGRGTRIVLHLNKYDRHYLVPEIITEIIKKYSQFISYPITLQDEMECDDEVTDDEKEDDETVKYTDDEELNNIEAIWTRNSNNISQQEYEEFYKSLNEDGSVHLALKHFKVEGQIVFRALLFVPRIRPVEWLKCNEEKKSNIKLYVRRVLIMENCNFILPNYLRFLKGVVDSDDFPLNISLGSLQHSQILETIGINLVKKALDLFEELAEDKKLYKTFYEIFSNNLKEGLLVDIDENRVKLAALLRFYTLKSGDMLLSLQDYIDRMREDQKCIYFINVETRQEATQSIFTEKIKECGLDVVYMTEPIDEYVVNKLKKYNGVPLVSVTRSGLELPENKAEKIKKEVDRAKFANLCTVIKSVLDSKVENVVVSNRLVQSASCIVNLPYGWSANMERIKMASPLQLRNKSITIGYMLCKKLLEINPDHLIIETLRRKVDTDECDTTIRNVISILFDATLLLSGFPLYEPQTYVNRIYRLIEFGLDIDGEGYEQKNKMPLHIDDTEDDLQVQEVD